MKKYLNRLYQLLKSAAKDPRVFLRVVNTVPSICSACGFSRAYKDSGRETGETVSPAANPLWEYFQNHKVGRGIWKWEHYFDIYHRHLARFVGRKVDVLEIGIYSGGSLGMWRSYFGEQSHLYGVDIEGACRAYASDHVTVFIGDQANRAFWADFREKVEGIDVIIDDGGHDPEQQRITLEEMLPRLRSGGVYLCEDVHGRFHKFAAYATGLVNELNSMNPAPSPFQSAIHSIHFYPFFMVIEKHDVPISRLSPCKHGTEWQPFYHWLPNDPGRKTVPEATPPP
ncbi:MAG: class I SAM-dependent methyltransferase [Verrucomicrobia bacterium]|nr:class I SAM-dependent methyltransferase [Verrucomicrobiota bacterium]